MRPELACVAEAAAPPLRGAAVTPARTLIVPGWQDSGPDHWQTHWQQCLGAARVQQHDWVTPRCDDWVAGLQRAVLAAGAPVVLVAHSLGCITVAHWVLRGEAAWLRATVRGALLVAPADVERAAAPSPLRSFAPVPRLRLPFPALVVASSDDPFCAFERAVQFALDWGAGLRSLGRAGHINASAGYDRWDQGLALLKSFEGSASFGAGE